MPRVLAVLLTLLLTLGVVGGMVAIATPVEADAPPPDDEVLRELGAFDPTEEDAEPQAASAVEAEAARENAADAPAPAAAQPKRV